MTTTLGARILAARTAAGLTQQQLADATGLAPSAVSHYETGRREPGAQRLADLCRALDVDANVILGLPVHDAGELRRLRRAAKATAKALEPNGSEA